MTLYTGIPPIEAMYFGAIPILEKPEVPLQITALENRSYGVGTGLRYYNILAEGYATGPDGITCFMLPVIMSVMILDQGAGIYAVRALTGGYPEPTYSYQWKLDGDDIATTETIDANGLTGDLTLEMIATNEHGSDVVVSDAVTLSATTEPVHLGSLASNSGSGGPVASWQPTSPAYSAGDLVIVNNAIDHGDYSASLTAPNGETVTKVVADLDSENGSGGSGAVTQTVFWYIATDSRAQGQHMTVTPSTNDYMAGTVTVFDAGTFDPASPIGDIATNNSGGSQSDPAVFPATASTTEAGIVLRLGTVDVNQFSLPVTGHENSVESTSGITSAMSMTRTAAVGSGDSVAAVNVGINGVERWHTATLIVRGA